jgi:CRP-like cAMP-binding protein
MSAAQVDLSVLKFTDREAGEAVKSGKLDRYSSGDLVVVEGRLLFIVSGTVNVLVKGRKAKVLRPGDSFGACAVFNGVALPANSLIAAESSVVLYLDALVAKDIASSFPQLKDDLDLDDPATLAAPPSRALHLEKAANSRHADRQTTAMQAMRPKLAELLTRKTFEPGQDVVQQGDPCESMFVIVSGKMEVLVDERFVRWLRDGDFFGEKVLMGETPMRSATVRIPEDCSQVVCYLLRYEDLSSDPLFSFTSVLKKQSRKGAFDSAHMVRNLAKEMHMAEQVFAPEGPLVFKKASATVLSRLVTLSCEARERVILHAAERFWLIDELWELDGSDTTADKHFASACNPKGAPTWKEPTWKLRRLGKEAFVALFVRLYRALQMPGEEEAEWAVELEQDASDDWMRWVECVGKNQSDEQGGGDLPPLAETMSFEIFIRAISDAAVQWYEQHEGEEGEDEDEDELNVSPYGWKRSAGVWVLGQLMPCVALSLTTADKTDGDNAAKAKRGGKSVLTLRELDAVQQGGSGIRNHVHSKERGAEQAMEKDDVAVLNASRERWRSEVERMRVLLREYEETVATRRRNEMRRHEMERKKLQSGLRRTESTDNMAHKLQRMKTAQSGKGRARKYDHGRCHQLLPAEERAERWATEAVHAIELGFDSGGRLSDPLPKSLGYACIEMPALPAEDGAAVGAPCLRWVVEDGRSLQLQQLMMGVEGSKAIAAALEAQLAEGSSRKEHLRCVRHMLKRAAKREVEELKITKDAEQQAAALMQDAEQQAKTLRERAREAAEAKTRAKKMQKADDEQSTRGAGGKAEGEEAENEQEAVLVLLACEEQSLAIRHKARRRADKLLSLIEVKGAGSSTKQTKGQSQSPSRKQRREGETKVAQAEQSDLDALGRRRVEAEVGLSNSSKERLSVLLHKMGIERYADTSNQAEGDSEKAEGSHPPTNPPAKAAPMSVPKAGKGVKKAKGKDDPKPLVGGGEFAGFVACLQPLLDHQSSMASMSAQWFNQGTNFKDAMVRALEMKALVEVSVVQFEDERREAECIVSTSDIVHTKQNPPVLLPKMQPLWLPLTALNLSGNGIGDVGAELLAAILAPRPSATSSSTKKEKAMDCGTLKSLWLGDNQINDRGAEALAKSLKGNSRLVTLSLFRNGITDAGASHFVAELKKNTSLRSVYLGFNPVSDQAVDRINNSIARRQLQLKQGLEALAPKDKGKKGKKGKKK